MKESDGLGLKPVDPDSPVGRVFQKDLESQRASRKARVEDTMLQRAQKESLEARRDLGILQEKYDTEIARRQDAEQSEADMKEILRHTEEQRDRVLGIQHREYLTLEAYKEVAEQARDNAFAQVETAVERVETLEGAVGNLQASVRSHQTRHGYGAITDLRILASIVPGSRVAEGAHSIKVISVDMETLDGSHNYSALKRLKAETGVHVVVYENTDQSADAVKRRLRERKIADVVDRIYTSGDLGTSKDMSDPGGFNHMAWLVKNDFPDTFTEGVRVRGSTLHIGIDAETDYIGAMNAGMQAALYKPETKKLF